MAEKRKQLNNRGFSLIELIVAMAIAGVVSILIASLMTNSSKWFSTESTKSILQNELQDVTEQLNTAFMEATGIRIEKDGEVTYIYTGEYDDSLGNWKNPTGSERVIIRKGEKLWLRTTKPDDVDNQDAGYLLTDKLEHFSFELNNVTKDWPDVVKDTKTTKGYVTNPISVHIDIGLAYRRKTTKITQNIRLRNNPGQVTLTGSSGAEVYEVISRAAAAKFETS